MHVNSVGVYNIHGNTVDAGSVQHNKYSVPSAVAESAMKNDNIPFTGFFSDLFTKKFSTPEEKRMYKELNSSLIGKDKINFDILYKTGRLSNRESNDKSSTLENLYKIVKNPRIQGLDSKKILSETIERLANPFIINQKFGQIPENLATTILQEKINKKSVLDTHPYDPKTNADMNVANSACCVAASIEFALADKRPAEFARFAESLSGKDMSVSQNIKLANLNKNVLDALYLLKMFNVKPEKADWTKATIKIAPDRDAIIRARVQNTQYDGMNRSGVDVLMQSAFMQLGSQSTYNTLTDKRYGSLNANDTGLTEFEKTFVESIVNNDGEKTSVVYQNVDDNAILNGYFYSPDVVEKHILTTLEKNKDVIIGITETDANKKIIGGHEITIVGSEMKDGERYFICNDTDDNYVGQIKINAKTLIPKIHHAGIPVDILPVINEEDKGRALLKDYAKKYLSVA